MKHTKLFEGFLSEKKFTIPAPNSCASELCNIMMPSINKVTELVTTYTVPAELIKIQSEVNKMQKLVTDLIRSGSSSTRTEELDWERAPKAPIFVLNLKQRYPQNEAKYYELWYKAAERQPVFSYGGAIAIFKTYAKREELMLEEHDYDNEYNELTEEASENLFSKKDLFEAFSHYAFKSISNQPYSEEELTKEFEKWFTKKYNK